MGRVKENSGVSDGRFFTKKKKEEKKTWAQNTGFCIIIILRHTYFFQFLGGDPFQLRSWSEGWKISLFFFNPSLIWQISIITK